MFYIRHTSPRSIQALLQPSRKSGPQSLPIVTFQGKALSKPEDPNDTFHRAIPPENNNNSDLNLDDILPPKPKHRRRMLKTLPGVYHGNIVWQHFALKKKFFRDITHTS